jgi:peptidoglycan/LPS O-acetylase OafA/YrhL
VRFELPGVFETNPYPLRVNSNLWTIPPGIFCYLFIACMIVMVAYKSRIAMLSAAVVLIGVNLYKDHVEGWWVSEGLVSVRHLVLCFVFGAPSCRTGFRCLRSAPQSPSSLSDPPA